MATLRKMLASAGFDWDAGVIVYQPVTDAAHSPGWADDDDILPGYVIENDHPILDEEFNAGYGSPQMPRFFARDGQAVYFPTQYDGATAVERVAIEIGGYVNGSPTPYPGG